MCKQIEEKLEYAFSPVYFMVLDESDKHNVPPGTESHFKVILVTEKFAAQRMIARHQAVYELLADALSNSVHALALHTYTPTEWQQRQQKALSSPACRGGE
ncbi:transcriptional regulator BolA [Arsenophonus endosymbiont of Aleurodicus floccissimus]|uniref:transcriptional regulator BolA n=1 Tax=Arsenophonus endosymbiont of Aleurodicus floccissimus TaxID=2152761 RepID=UPI00192D3AD1|nr:transcriptional regulator BolA [Arsenophonus endosymbiont of Aleurodicus floccissimus]